jgi:predicted ATP-dependent serine protease
LAKQGNRVLYVAGEQHNTPVMTGMLGRLKITDFKNFGIVKKIGNKDLNNFDVLVIDSKDSLDFSLEDFKQLRDRYPHLSFVILSQATKTGGFTGTEKWRNEVDTLIYCESLLAFTNRDKNRWGGSSEVQILSLIPKGTN